MGIISKQRWESLETWGPRLFVVGAALELVFATNHGLAYLVDGISFIEWVYPTVLLGRVALLLGVAGLSGQIAVAAPSVAKLCRVVVALAVLFTIGLLSTVLLDLVGITTPIIAVFGFGTVALTILTFLLFGVVILRTGAMPTRIGAILVAMSVTILTLLVGMGMLPTSVVGSIGEGAVAALSLAMWYSLQAAPLATERSEPAADTVTE